MKKIPSKNSTIDEAAIVRKLINTYPNSVAVTVEYNNWPRLDFVETVDNFAEDIMRDFDTNRQIYHFGVSFENKEDCARYLATYLHSINEICQAWIEDNYYVEDGDLYYDGEEED